mgnify:CR=1 FL=1
MDNRLNMNGLITKIKGMKQRNGFSVPIIPPVGCIQDDISYKYLYYTQFFAENRLTKGGLRFKGVNIKT